MKPLSAEDLKRLPLRAIVAYAARWAQRVRPGFVLPDPHIRWEHYCAVDAAVAAAKAFAQGGETPTDPQHARAIAMAGYNAAGAADNSRARNAARTAALAAESLAQALCAFGSPLPTQADDLLEPDDSLTWAGDTAATMAHSAEYSARFVLRESDIEEAVTDDYATLLEQCAGRADRIGDPLDVAGLGPLWSGAEPEWPT